MKPIVLTEKDKRRFWSKVAPPDSSGCMLWTAGVGHDGRYGRFQLAGKVYYAHRVAYVIATGEQIPDGMSVDHTCWITKCVNPDHLQAVAPKLNSENRRGAQRGARSGVRGVNWNATHGMWFVRVGHNGNRHFGGYFSNVEDAEKAAIALRTRLHTNNLRDRQSGAQRG